MVNATHSPRGRAPRLLLLLLAALLAVAQAPPQPRKKSAAERRLEATTRSFLAALQAGSPAAVTPYLSPRGVTVDMDGERASLAEIRKQFAARTGLYCRWFDTPCLKKEMDDQSGGVFTQRTSEPRSYRELLRLATRRDLTVLVDLDTPAQGSASVCLHGPKLSAEGAGYLLEFGFERVGGQWRLALEEGNFAGC